MLLGFGEIVCSRESGGDAVITLDGVSCLGGCKPAAPAHCERIVVERKKSSKPNAEAASHDGPHTLDLEGFGAGNEVRTRDLNLGKVALYQLSYSRRSGVP